MKHTSTFIVPLLLITAFFFYSCQPTQRREEYANGSTRSICELKHGLRNGVCTSYYENGIIASTNSYTNDTLQGECKYFHRNGKLSWQVHFDHGQKNGVVHYYDSLGLRYQTSTYLHGLLEGPSYSYYPSGIVKMKITYHRNRRDGYYVFFDETGKIKRKETYSEGRRLDVTEYDSLGNKVMHPIKSITT